MRSSGPGFVDQVIDTPPSGSGAASRDRSATDVWTVKSESLASCPGIDASYGVTFMTANLLGVCGTRSVMALVEVPPMLLLRSSKDLPPSAESQMSAGSAPSQENVFVLPTFQVSPPLGAVTM